MDTFFSAHLHYYLLLFLFTALFLLQVWAILKIKEMIRRVPEIYSRAQSLGRARAMVSENDLTYGKRICQHCRYRETFINMSDANLFHYRCRLNNQPIKLDDFCRLFEFDPLSTET